MKIIIESEENITVTYDEENIYIARSDNTQQKYNLENDFAPNVKFPGIINSTNLVAAVYHAFMKGEDKIIQIKLSTTIKDPSKYKLIISPYSTSYSDKEAIMNPYKIIINNETDGIDINPSLDLITGKLFIKLNEHPKKAAKYLFYGDSMEMEFYRMPSDIHIDYEGTTNDSYVNIEKLGSPNKIVINIRKYKNTLLVGKSIDLSGGEKWN